MYKELTSVGVYMLIYTPWNSFDVWLHHSMYIYIYIYIHYLAVVTRQNASVIKVSG